MHLKAPLEFSVQSSGPRGPGFESRHSDQIHVVKMLFGPQGQCFQRIQGPQMMKSEGLEILLLASRFPKQTRLELTHPIAQPYTVIIGRHLQDAGLFSFQPLKPFSFPAL